MEAQDDIDALKNQIMDIYGVKNEKILNFPKATFDTGKRFGKSRLANLLPILKTHLECTKKIK